MPSQITHYLFAKDAIRKSLNGRTAESILALPELIAWSAQGPDFFYHNQRTSPNAFKYGRILHRGGYGTLVYHLMQRYFTEEKENHERFKSFLYPFVTHAVLDRHTHPFIIYFSGWREPGKTETYELYRMHAYFERIIDSHLCGESTAHFFKEVRAIDKHFDFLSENLIEGIRKTYTKLNKPDLDEERFSNACFDALFFYNATDCSDRGKVLHAYQRDKELGFSRKILALYYPRHYDTSVDYLNENRAEWRDPFNPEQRMNESFYDLYEEAKLEASKILASLDAFLSEGDGNSFSQSEIEELIGNGNLSNGDNNKNASPFVSGPLPLYEQLAREYCGVEKEFGLDQSFKHKQPVKGAVNCL